MQRAQSISGIGESTRESTIMHVSSARKASCMQLFRHKKVHTKQGFTNHAVGRTIYNTISTRKLASYLLNHFFFVDFFFLAIELSDSDSCIHFTNFLDTDMHSPTILRSFDFISLHFVLLCLLQFPWKAEHAPQYTFRWLLCPRGSQACPSLFTINAKKTSVKRQLQHPSKRTTFKNIVYLSEHTISSYPSK